MAKTQETAVAQADLFQLLSELSERLDAIQESQTQLLNQQRLFDERLTAVEEATIKNELSGPKIEAAMYAGMNPGLLFQSIVAGVLSGAIAVNPSMVSSKPQYLARLIQDSVDKTQAIMVEISKRTPKAFGG